MTTPLPDTTPEKDGTEADAVRPVTAAQPRRGVSIRRVGAGVAIGGLLAVSVLATRPAPWLRAVPGPAADLAAAVAGQQPEGAANPQLTSTQARMTTVEVKQLTWGRAAVCALSSSCQMSPASTSKDEAKREAASAAAQWNQAQVTAASLARELAGPNPPHPAAVLTLPDLGVAGPSAGLMTTLVFTAALSNGTLGTHPIAGTGEVDANGNVLPVGAIADKVAGAASHGVDVFFVPQNEAPAAREAAPKTMQVVGVSTVTQALRWMCSHGATLTACQAGH